MIRIFATLLLSFSIAFAGFPVQAAQPECPMAKMMKMEHGPQMDMQGMEDCDGCDKMAKQESDKSGCCDDATCNAQCSAMNSSVSMNLPSVKAETPAINQLVQRFYAVDAHLPSAHLNSQERPPKHLS
jgi:hypothetical protein